MAGAAAAVTKRMRISTNIGRLALRSVTWPHETAPSPPKRFPRPKNANESSLLKLKPKGKGRLRFNPPLAIGVLLPGLSFRMRDTWKRWPASSFISCAKRRSPI